MEKKRFQLTRLLILLLAVATVVCGFAGCKKKNPDDTGESGTAGPALPDNVDENGFELDSIPDTLDYGDKEVKFLCWSELVTYIMPTDENTPPATVEYELYLRKFEVEERLGIYIELIPEVGSYANRVNFLDKIRNAATGDYDVICSYSLLPPVLATEGKLYNLNNLDYPELEKPWWTESVQDWEQYGSLYFVADNSHVNLLDSLEVLFVNSQMFEDRGITNPITNVLDGNWYLDTMLEYARAWDGMNEGEGAEFGFVVDEWTRLDALYYSLGFSSIKKNSHGESEFGYLSGRDVDLITGVIDKLVPLFESSYATFDSWDAQAPKLMKTKKAAMEVSPLSSLKQMEDTTYAPIPLPKRDSTQENYRIMLTNAYDVWCVPKVATDMEMSGVIIEAMASSDYRTIAPYYYENRMKMNYSNDEVGASMFDIIRESVYYDFGRISQLSIDENYALESGWRRVFSTDMVTLTPSNGYFATFVAGIRENAPGSLQKILDMYEMYSDR